MIIYDAVGGFYPNNYRFVIENLHLSFSYETIVEISEWLKSNSGTAAIIKPWSGAIYFKSAADRTMFLLRWPAENHQIA